MPYAYNRSQLKNLEIGRGTMWMWSSLFEVLPTNLLNVLRHLPEQVRTELEEIRVRENRALEIGYGGKYAFLAADGKLLDQAFDAYRPTHEDMMRLLDTVSSHSLYAFEEELRRGYITMRGGHRVGLAGRTMLEQGKVRHIKEIGGMNIRLAREVIGGARTLLPKITDPLTRTVHHTLLVSPPQQGKTTVLRDLARMISCGEWPHLGVNWGGRKVGIVDERSELAACVKGVPTFDVGPRTDVMDSCPKAEGMMMMIRSMSPEVLIVDEIGRASDVEAIEEAVHAGIRVVATAHGYNMADILRRPMLSRLHSQCAFSRYVLLTRTRGGAPSFEVIEASDQMSTENRSVRT